MDMQITHRHQGFIIIYPFDDNHDTEITVMQSVNLETLTYEAPVISCSKLRQVTPENAAIFASALLVARSVCDDRANRTGKPYKAETVGEAHS